jgi:hypothetical protein
LAAKLDDPNSGNTAKKRKVGALESPSGTQINDEEKQAWEHEPVVHLCKITAKEIKRRTGFDDLEALLAYVAIICDGNIHKVCETATCLADLV